MKKTRRNPDVEFQVEDASLDFDRVQIKNWSDTDIKPEAYAIWYDQYLKLGVDKQKEIYKQALEYIKKEKPKFFTHLSRNNCELVGIMPRVEYALVDDKSGNTDVNWIHSFSQATLLFWDKNLEAGLFTNVNLMYNDTKLNYISGNAKEKLKGFTN